MLHTAKWDIQSSPAGGEQLPLPPMRRRGGRRGRVLCTVTEIHGEVHRKEALKKETKDGKDCGAEPGVAGQKHTENHIFIDELYRIIV